MHKKFGIANIEAGMPTVAEAKKKLLYEISGSKKQGIIALKIIHGYGSSGIGGKLRVEMRKMLAQKKREGAIRSFVIGEEWSIFNQFTREILDHCKDLRQDSDLEKYNSGITVVLL